MRDIKKICAALLLITFTIILSTNVCTAAPEDNKTLRIGYMDYSGFIEQQSDGTYYGYGAEYLAKISDYTGYHYEYVYGEWPELLKKLANKEIDLVCNAQYTSERAEAYDYTSYPIGYTQGLLYGAKDSNIAYEDFVAFNGMHVGVIHENAMLGIFEQYERQHNFSCEIMEYNDEDELSKALESGEIDAMCSEHLANHKDVTLLAEYGADSIYLMSYKNSPYISELNYALQEIKTDVDFESNLFHKYYDSSAAETTLLFTKEEKNFIANCGTLRVGINGDRAPFSAYDKKTGKFNGICVDVLDDISKKSGLQFEYVEQTPGVPTVEMLESGDYDIICGVERDNFITNEQIASTKAFLESAVVPVGKSGRDLNLSDHLTVAIPASYKALQKSLEMNYPNLNIVGYTYSRQGLDAVVSGKADIFVQNTHLLSLMIQEPKYEKLNVLPVEIMTEHTAMAIPRNETLLLSVLNKSIENTDTAIITGSLIEHTFASPYRYTFRDFMYRFRIQLIVLSGLLLICFALLILVAVIKQHSAETLTIANANLEKAVEKADSANVAKSQFLAQMSHEIRTPMNAIIGLTQIAKKEIKNPEKIDDYLNKIDGSSRLLLSIINDVLDMSAIEGGKLKIEQAPFDFKRLLTDITTIFYQQTKVKKVDFQVWMNGVTEEAIIGDELRVKQILMNILSNAVKFTPSGGEIHLVILQSSLSQDKVQFRFTVSDTGAGMSKDMLSRLFRPFEQESASTARKHGGSGLGLSITKNLVEMMGGAIGVDSEVGKGSTFTVDLSFGVVKKQSAESTNFSKIRTLIVDDDEESCQYSGILLERMGVPYEYVTCGEAALERLGEAEDKGDPFKLCLIDWKMNDMNGVEVTRKIREIFGEETIVIIVSAYDLNEVEDSGRAAGADYFIPKPLFQSTIFNALMHISGKEENLLDLPKKTDDFDFTGKKVLVAEDVELNMEVAVSLLEMVGIQVTCASDGKQAVEIYESSPEHYFDCILLDINMPEMDGYEAAEAIRDSEKVDADTVSIYAMTANAFSEDVAKALNAGMNGHIAKPVEAVVLYQTLQSVFDNQVK